MAPGSGVFELRTWGHYRSTPSISLIASSIEPIDTRCFTQVIYREPSGKGRVRQMGFRAVKKVG